MSVLIKDQITPWIEIADTGPFRMTGFRGAQIKHDGKHYMGAAQQNFWNGYIEPFLEQICATELSAAAAAAEHRGLDPNAVLAEVEDLLRIGVLRVYHEMARIDQALCKLDMPNAQLRGTDGYVAYMQAYIAERIRAERALWGTMSPAETWHMRNRFRAWMITTVLAGLALIVAIIGVFR
jgi:hypothetical protein